MKNISKLLGILAAASLTLCMGLFAACGEQETPAGQNEKTTYTVTVLDPTGEPVEGLKVKWGDVKTVYTTLDSGKATANLPSGSYAVAFENLPAIYKYSPVTVTGDEPDKTIGLAWNPAEGNVVYSVKVLLPNGDPVSGVKAEMCVFSDGAPQTCTLLPDATDSKGVTYSISAESELFGLPAGEYGIKLIIGVPAGYTFPAEEDGYYATKATAENPNVTIVLEAAAS